MDFLILLDCFLVLVVRLFQLVQTLALFNHQIFQSFEIVIIDCGGALRKRQNQGAAGGDYSEKLRADFHKVRFWWVMVRYCGVIIFRCLPGGTSKWIWPGRREDWRARACAA